MLPIALFQVFVLFFYLPTPGTLLLLPTKYDRCVKLTTPVYLNTNKNIESVQSIRICLNYNLKIITLMKMGTGYLPNTII